MVCSLTQANAGTRFSYLQQKHLIIFSQKNEYWSCTYAPISTDQKFNLCIFCNLKESENDHSSKSLSLTECHHLLC